MQNIEVLVSIVFPPFAVLLGTGMFLSYRLFKLLEKKYPPYYKLIGRPLINGPIKNFNYDDIDIIYIRLFKGSVFCYAVVFKGVPKDFPKDVGARKLTKAIRIVFALLIVLSILLIILGYFLYKSGA